MLNTFLIISGKLISRSIQSLKLGNGSTWPGHIALRFNKDFISDIASHSRLKIIIIAGTNGKTTTSRMIRTILEAQGYTILHNESGANLLNGIASTLLLSSTISGKVKADYAIFEVDENSLPLVTAQLTPDYILLLNLFRDQLDRYGEVDTIAHNWEKALSKLPEKTTLVVNADDPKTAYLGMQKPTTVYFGLEKGTAKTAPEHAADSVYCPRCGEKLTYSSVSYSHLGDWHCSHCHLKRPTINVSEYFKTNLIGTYNIYNALGAVAISRELGTQGELIAKALKTFTPAFGRQEKISFKNRQIQVLLAKNPTGFNESLRTITEQKAKNLLLVLNDRVADGKDVSWIWDIDLETFMDQFTSITVAGDRAYDMGLRVKYASKEQKPDDRWHIEENVANAIDNALNKTPQDETLYILPTYTAMLEVRQVLTGKKIL